MSFFAFELIFRARFVAELVSFDRKVDFFRSFGLLRSFLVDWLHTSGMMLDKQGAHLFFVGKETCPVQILWNKNCFRFGKESVETKKWNPDKKSFLNKNKNWRQIFCLSVGGAKETNVRVDNEICSLAPQHLIEWYLPFEISSMIIPIPRSSCYFQKLLL